MVLGIVIAAIPASILLEVNFLTSIILFFGLPSFYLLYRHEGEWKRIFTASSLFGIVYGFLLDYLAELNNAWSWGAEEQLVFSYKILGVVNVDVMIWFFFWIFFLVIFYEHFLDHDHRDNISNNIAYGIAAPGVLGLYVLAANIFYPPLLTFNNAYLMLGLMTLPFFLYAIYQKPTLMSKFSKAALFFVPTYLAYEITALHLNLWEFPGEYISMVEIMGASFPLEEFLIWILLSSIIVLSYYELFIDDMR